MSAIYLNLYMLLLHGSHWTFLQREYTISFSPFFTPNNRLQFIVSMCFPFILQIHFVPCLGKHSSLDYSCQIFAYFIISLLKCAQRFEWVLAIRRFYFQLSLTRRQQNSVRGGDNVFSRLVTTFNLHITIFITRNRKNDKEIFVKQARLCGRFGLDWNLFLEISTNNGNGISISVFLCT